METRTTCYAGATMVCDHQPGLYLSLDVHAGGDKITMFLPEHMADAARKIASAFNAAISEPTDARIPTGGSASALALTAALTAGMDLDEAAAHAIERRDLP